MLEDKLDDDEQVRDTVVLNSKMIDSSPNEMYITSEKLLFGPHNVKRSDIVNIELVEDSRTDYKSIGVILTHSVLGIMIAYTILSSIALSFLIVGITSMMGYGVVRMLKNKPFGYVSLETEDAEYRFGIQTPLDAARLFSKVYDNLDKELTHEAFQTSEESNIKPPRNLSKSVESE
jgi:hypothetical protein